MKKSLSLERDVCKKTEREFKKLIKSQLALQKVQGER